MRDLPRRHPGAARRCTTELEELARRKIARPLTTKELARTERWTPAFGLLKPNGKIRTITDLRGLNATTEAPRFQYDGLDSLKTLLATSPVTLQWMCKLDMSEWFYNVPLATSTSRWIRVRLQQKGYEILCMPFGLSVAPYWSAKLGEPIANALKLKKVILIWYVDDILVLSDNYQKLESQVTDLIQLLTSLGVAINPAKCLLTPTRSLEFLGIQVNLENEHEPKWEIPSAKRVGILKEIDELLKRDRVPPKVLSKIAGKAQYLVQADAGLLGWPKVLSRAAAKMAYKWKYWTRSRWVHPIARLALGEIKNALLRPHPCKIYRKEIINRWTMYTDASNSGWGAVATSPGKARRTFSGHWTEPQSRLHITAQEALATQLALEALERLEDLRDCALYLKTDSVAVRAALAKGSARPGVNGPAVRVVTRLAELACELHAAWVASGDNVADSFSRKQQPEDYKLEPRLFNRALKYLGMSTPKWDLFAARHNACARKYYAEQEDGGPGLQGVNSLGQSWVDLEGPIWCNPPFSLMGEVLKKIRRERPKQLILVAPVWRSAPWWSALEEMTVKEFLVPANIPVYVRRGFELVPPPRWRTTVRVVRA